MYFKKNLRKSLKKVRVHEGAHFAFLSQADRAAGSLAAMMITELTASTPSGRHGTRADTPTCRQNNLVLIYMYFAITLQVCRFL